MISSVLRSAMLRRSRPASEWVIRLIWLHRAAIARPVTQTGAKVRALYRARVDIAVVVNGGVAETLQSTPLLRTLRAGFPTARIALVCPSTAVDLADGIPPVDLVIPLAGLRGSAHRRRPALAHAARPPTRCGLPVHLGRGPAASAYFAGIAQRSGVGGGMRSLLLTGRVRARAGRKSRRDLASACPGRRRPSGAAQPGLRAGTGGAAPSRAGAPRQRARATGASWWPSRRAPDSRSTTLRGRIDGWDPERWAHLANQLAQRHGAGILLVGSPQDRYAAERTKIDLRADATDLVGEIDLATLAGVIARCDLLVGSDTPLLQLAAAMGTPDGGAVRSDRRRARRGVRPRPPRGPGA